MTIAPPLVRFLAAPTALAMSMLLASCGGPESPAAAPESAVDASSEGPMTEQDATADDSTGPWDAGAESPPIDCEQALTSDFDARDALSQSDVPESAWYTDSMKGSWGPGAADYPLVEPPPGCAGATWKRDRVLAVANKHVALPYQHHHIPGWDPQSVWPDQEGPGLDCSNFTSWVYNYALGLRFTSNVEAQADGPDAPGRRLDPAEPLEPADRLFILNEEKTAVSHAVLYIDAEHIIDSTGPGVEVRSFAGWYKSRYSHARRVVE